MYLQKYYDLASHIAHNILLSDVNNIFSKILSYTFKIILRIKP